ncbi:MAG: VWA domain-containing protein [Candidatus Aenigmarchaeota archaeon]|nr:VWA domain-containing protein [Candidatus Aenigmarchaeota archaeon]
MSWQDWLYARVERPELVLLIIPIVIVLWIVLQKDFIRLKEDPEVVRQKRKLRALMFFTRSALFLLLLSALASPFSQTEKVVEGDPFITLLVDNSSSMSLFENIADSLRAKLEKKLNVEFKSVGSSERSDIGDGILANLQPQQSILLLADGNSNEGANLGDVALYASRINTTINAIHLKPVHDDAAVLVVGPSKTMEDVENTFYVRTHQVGQKKPVHVVVSVDGKPVIDTITSDEKVEFTQTFGGGYHQIVARIDGSDFFAQNNAYYKTVKVVPKPKVLFFGQGASPLLSLISDLYEVVPTDSLPMDLSDFYAIVVNNLDKSVVDARVERLSEYVTDGNGVVVVGGKASYDLGEYRNSVFETMLPVTVGTPEKKEGDINVVIVIDISGSTGSAYAGGKAVDVEKALAIGVLQDLEPKHKLAVIAFNTAAYLVSDVSYVFEKVNLDDRIASVRDGGGTLISAGLLKALALLEPLSGSKNIILISDGKTQAVSVAEEAAKAASNSGVRIYTVGVGPSTNEEIMQRLADITNGVYFRATERSRLKLLFGKPEEQPPEGGQLALAVLNSNHFITEGLELDAHIYGYNSVAPKTTARLLVTTTTGEPIVTVWRLGLGRVVAYSTDDGSGWAGEALNKKNSRLVSRMMNWAIGDPDRKSKEFIEAGDTRQNEPTQILVKSQTAPKAEGIVFYKIDQDTYSATITPKDVGFQTVAGAFFAVNSPAEYELLGENEALGSVVVSTGGRFFNPEEVDEIVEFAKSKARRTINTKEYIIWPFVLLSIIIYLIEIFIRRTIRRD